MLNGGIKWQSDYDIIACSVELKDLIDLYCLHFYDELVDGILTTDDWSKLKGVLALLKPIKRALLIV